MVRAQGLVGGGERGALLVRQLLRVEADRKAVGARGGEHAFDLLAGEGDGFAEGIDAGGEPSPRDRGNHVFADHLQEGFATRALLRIGRESMRGEQGGDDPDGLVVESLCRLEQFAFVGGIETVTRFDLDRGDPARHQRPEAAARLCDQRLGLGGANCLDRRDDAAAGHRDFRVGRAGAPHGMLVRARAREDQVRVAIDESGRDPRAAQRHDFLGAKAGKLGAAADADDSAAIDPDGSVPHYPERISRRCDHGCDMAVGDEAIPHASRQSRRAC